MVTAETTAMGTFLASAGETVTWVFGKIATVADAIVSNPILLVTTGVMLAGAVVGIFGRLLSKN